MKTLTVRWRLMPLLIAAALVQPGSAQEPTSVEAMSQALSRIVINSAVRRFVECHLRAALWGGYNAQARVSAPATTDSTSRIVRITQGRFIEEPDPVEIIGLAEKTREGIVSVSTQEAAFTKGMPFYVTDVVLETPVLLRYTVVSNPNAPKFAQAFARLEDATGTELLDPLSPSPQPQQRSWTLRSPVQRSVEHHFGILVNDPVGNTPVLCLASNEFKLP